MGKLSWFFSGLLTPSIVSIAHLRFWLEIAVLRFCGFVVLIGNGMECTETNLKSAEKFSRIWPTDISTVFSTACQPLSPLGRSTCYVCTFKVCTFNTKEESGTPFLSSQADRWYILSLFPSLRFAEEFCEATHVLGTSKTCWRKKR